ATAGRDRGNKRRGLWGDEDQEGSSWGLFQGLEERILGLLRHRLGLIQDENLSSSLVRREGCLAGQGADLIDLDRGAFRDDQMDIGVNFLGDLATGGTASTAIRGSPAP